MRAELLPDFMQVGRTHAKCICLACMQNDCDTNKRMAWVPKGELSKCKTIFLKGRRYTGIVAMSMDCIIARSIFEVPANKEIFSDFFVNDVVRMSCGTELTFAGCFQGCTPDCLFACLVPWFLFLSG